MDSSFLEDPFLADVKDRDPKNVTHNSNFSEKVAVFGKHQFIAGSRNRSSKVPSARTVFVFCYLFNYSSYLTATRGDPVAARKHYVAVGTSDTQRQKSAEASTLAGQTPG
jgi:hypothetical protein